jgi:hypothetical protein
MNIKTQHFVDDDTVDSYYPFPQNHKVRMDVLDCFTQMTIDEVLSLHEGDVVWVDIMGLYFERQTVASVEDCSTERQRLIVVRFVAGSKRVMSSTVKGRDCVPVDLYSADEEALHSCEII